MKTGPTSTTGEFNFMMHIIVVCFVLFILGTKGITNENTYQGDVHNYALNGIYFSDILKDLPLTNLFDYTVHYYAQYPALSMGHHAPFLSVIIGIFYLFTGYSIVNGKIVVVLFAIMGAIIWYLLIERIFDRKIALYASLLLVSNPFIITYTRVIKTEIPTLSLIILATYLFYRYCESGEKKYVYSFAVCASLCVWTKQVAVFMFPVYFLYIVFSKKYNLLIKREAILSYFIIFLILSPFILITLKFAAANIKNVTGSPGKKLAGMRLLKPVTFLYSKHFILPVLVLSFMGGLKSIYTRNRNSLLFFLWIICCYTVITYLATRPRDTIYWIPPFCLFAAISMDVVSWRLKNVYLIELVIVTLFACQFVLSYYGSLPRITGYEEAAKFVVENRKGNAVFFDGYFDPTMVYFIRKHDKLREMIILRGSKILATSRMKKIIREKVSTEDEILSIFNTFGVKYIIVEDEPYIKLNVRSVLRQLLKTNDFALEKSILVKSSKEYSKFVPDKLLIYEYKGTGIPTGGILSMELPIVGKEINLPIDQIRLSHIISP